MLATTLYQKNKMLFFSYPLTLREQVIYSFLLVVTSIMLFYKYLDIPIATYFYSLDHTPINHFFYYVSMGGLAFPYLILSVIGYVLFRYYRVNLMKATQFGFIFQSLIISGAITDIIKWVAGRYRPHQYFENHLFGFDFFHIGGAYTSFPSGHTTTAFALATALTYLFPRWKWYWFIFALLIGASHIILAQHFLSDVILGSYIGITSVMLLLMMRNLNANEVFVHCTNNESN